MLESNPLGRTAERADRTRAGICRMHGDHIYIYMYVYIYIYIYTYTYNVYVYLSLSLSLSISLYIYIYIILIMNNKYDNEYSNRDTVARNASARAASRRRQQRRAGVAGSHLGLRELPVCICVYMYT